MDAKKYTIGELAKIIGVPSSTLRFYQKNKLISPSEKDDHNGYYYYTSQDIQKIEKAILLRSVGMPMKMVKEVLDGTQTEQSASRIFRDYLKELNQQIEKLNYSVHRVEGILRNYDRSKEYSMEADTFEIRHFQKRELLTKNCLPYQPKNMEEWVIQFSERSHRSSLPEMVPDILLSMGCVVSWRKYAALGTIVTNQVCLVCEKRENLKGWTNTQLAEGNYLIYRYDNSVISHENAFSKFESYLQAHKLKTENEIYHSLIESMLPILCTNMSFEIQAKLA